MGCLLKKLEGSIKIISMRIHHQQEKIPDELIKWLHTRKVTETSSELIKLARHNQSCEQ